ncbi:MBL fold metallo-hydrolase [Streptomyces iconiensis]|uniref:MBL fold metallo-hydrolase n=1 Tax=Streptomyces iconiensis TaxID=1384038 RepID=A0ABT7A0W2_9ACTN|nr:MBL fold metallo-hydrolase [Streptomyces iconiensis]MDJ1134970.1 MBL fold metallo-hydrolase [Streptomyces iconiensis]
MSGAAKRSTGRRALLRGAVGAGAGAVAAWALGGAGTAAGAARARDAAPPRHAGAGTETQAGMQADAGGVAARGSRVVSYRAGPFEVLALLDAHGPFPATARETFPEADAQDWARARRIDPDAFGPGDAWQLAFRCHAIRRPGGRVALVDSGVGPVGSPASGWAPVPGHLPEVLKTAGIAPRDVDTVVLTHLHEDHYGWTVSPQGVPLFPDARHVVQRAETAALSEDDSAQSYVVAPLRDAGLLHEIDGRVRLLRGHRTGGAVTAVPTPGHTPGHQSVLVDGGARRVVVTGDVLVHAVQLANPEVAYRLEADQPTARATRTALLSEARTHHALLATSHLNRPFLHAPPDGAH